MKWFCVNKEQLELGFGLGRRRQCAGIQEELCKWSTWGGSLDGAAERDQRLGEMPTAVPSVRSRTDDDDDGGGEHEGEDQQRPLNVRHLVHLSPCLPVSTQFGAFLSGRGMGRSRGGNWCRKPKLGQRLATGSRLTFRSFQDCFWQKSVFSHHPRFIKSRRFSGLVRARLRQQLSSGYQWSVLIGNSREERSASSLKARFFELSKKKNKNFTA